MKLIGLPYSNNRPSRIRWFEQHSYASFMVSAICDKKKERWGKLDSFDAAFNVLPLVYQSIRKLEKHLREDLIMFLSLRIKPQVSPSNLIKKNLSRQNLTSFKKWKSGGKLPFVKRTKRKIPVLFGWSVLNEFFVETLIVIDLRYK